MVKLSKIDSTFGALADPIRRTVLNRLSYGESSVSELARGFSISLPAFLKHVRVLENAGLVETRKVGRVRYCRHDPAQLAAAQQWIQDHQAFWERQMNSLEALLVNPTPKDHR